MLFGTADFLGGLAARRLPALAVTLVASLAGFALLVPAAAAVGGAPSAADFAWSAAGGVLGGLGVALLFHVLAIGPVASVAPVVAVCGVAMPALSGLAFGERPGAAALAGVALAALAVALVSAAGEGSHAAEAAGVAGSAGPGPAPRARPATLLLSALSGFGLGGFLVCISRVPEASGLWPLVAARAAGTAAVALALFATAARASLARPEPRAWAVSAISGLTDATANLLYLWVVRQHPLSIVGTIVSLSPATVVLLARLVLKERFHRAQVAGLALAALAIVLMTLRRA